MKTALLNKLGSAVDELTVLVAGVQAKMEETSEGPSEAKLKELDAAEQHVLAAIKEVEAHFKKLGDRVKSWKPKALVHKVKNIGQQDKLKVAREDAERIFEGRCHDFELVRKSLQGFRTLYRYE